MPSQVTTKHIVDADCMHDATTRVSLGSNIAPYSILIYISNVHYIYGQNCTIHIPGRLLLILMYNTGTWSNINRPNPSPTFGVSHLIGRMKVMVPYQSTSSEAKLHDIILPGYRSHNLSPNAWALAPFIMTATAAAPAAARRRKLLRLRKNAVAMISKQQGIG